MNGRCQRDDGFTMIEAMVAIALLSIVSLGFFYGMNQALGLTRDNRMRIQASQLAAREIEITRNEFTANANGPDVLMANAHVTNFHPLPGGTQGQPLAVDGARFTVDRDVETILNDTGTSPCDGGTLVTYPRMAVNVRVSWVEPTGTQTVASNTILTPAKNTLTGSYGYIAAKVTGSDGAGVRDVGVTGTSGSSVVTGETAADGCAVLRIPNAGTYTVSLAASGYVSFDGLTSPSKTAVVTAATLQVVPFSYDRAATLTITDQTLTGWSLPSPLPKVTLFNAQLLPSGTKVVPTSNPSAATFTVNPLWPFTDGYSVWPGTCTQSDPASAGRARPTPVVAPSGGTRTATALLSPITVSVDDSAGANVVGATVTAVPSVTTGCSGETSYTLGTTDANGQVKSSLPAGKWKVSVTGRTGNVTTPVLDGTQTEVVVPTLVVT